MMLSMMMILMIMNNMSPLNMSFCLIMMSFTISIMAYYKSSSLFMTSVIIISFSSGTMILFCYCSVLANYEMKSKNMSYLMMGLLILTILTMMYNPSKILSPSYSESMNLSSMLILVGMAMVVMSMISINKSLFYPIKNFLQNY